MTFAYPLPSWALLLVLAACAAMAWIAYRHAPLTRARRVVLSTVRLVTLLLIVIFLMRPVASSTAEDSRDAVVAVLVDSSRSMSIQDAAGMRRIDRARAIVQQDLLPAIAPRFRTEVLGFGDALRASDLASLSATATRSDVAGAIRAVRERYRGQPIAGIVFISDGGDTSGEAERAAADGGPPIFTLGVGSTTVGRDREVLGVTVAEAVLDDSRVDLAVSAVSHGHGTAPIELRLLENGRPIEVRRAAPAGDGTPVREVFHVSPPRGAPVVYSVEIPSAAGELVPENNARSVLVQAPSRPRRVLLVEGAPGFEHSFLKRALASDSGLEVDSVVRKGRNEAGEDTFYIQASRSRADALASGYPQKADDLFQYDALVLANVEAAQLTRAQLEATRDFVSKRGGGLLVLGAQSFVRRGLIDTAIEEALPLDLSDRGRGGVMQASNTRGMNRVALTPAGEAHPIMQFGAGLETTRKRWEAVPALASTAPLGGPRPGATVLAVTGGTGGTARALVAVQRYGDGRSMVFTGEASWRWRMLMPSSDRAYDTFWRQAVRWLAVPANDPTTVAAPDGASAGDPVTVRVAARDGAFDPLADATVDVRVTAPDGRIEHLRAAQPSGEDVDHRYVAQFKPQHPGVYRASAEVRRGSEPARIASGSFLVGGADLEMTDPRLNLQVLERIATASGGQHLEPNNTGLLLERLTAAVPAAILSVRRDLWHNAWSFVALIALLAGEWGLRRGWGLR